jgi:hypothetical protein
MEPLHSKIIDALVRQSVASSAISEIEKAVNDHQATIADANGALKVLDELLRETTGKGIQDTANTDPDFSSAIQKAVNDALGVEAAGPGEPPQEAPEDVPPATSARAGNRKLSAVTDDEDLVPAGTVGRGDRSHKIVVDDSPPTADTVIDDD